MIHRGEFTEDKRPLINLPPRYDHTYAITLSSDEQALYTFVRDNLHFPSALVRAIRLLQGKYLYTLTSIYGRL